MVQLESDIAGLQDLPYLCFDHIPRKSIFGNPEIQHSTSHRSGLEYRDGIAHKREIMRRRKTNGTTANNRYLVWKLRGDAAFVHIDCVLRLGTVTFGQEAFQRANRNRAVNFTASTGRFARMCANATTN